MKIYLAGAFAPYKEYKDWRDYVTKWLNQIHEFHNPLVDSRQECPMEFTMDDTMAAIECDCMLHYRTPNIENTGGDYEHGVRVGAYYATGQPKPIILVDESQFPYPLCTATAKRTFSNLEIAVLYLSLLRSWDDDGPAINAVLELEKTRT